MATTTKGYETLGQWRDNPNLRSTLNKVKTKHHWMVMRNGRPVSNLRHFNIGDCRQEFLHWARIVSTFPDGSKLGLMAGDGTYVPINFRIPHPAYNI